MEESIRKYVDLYTEFNFVAGCEGYHLEYNEFDDQYFHWSKNAFKHDKKIVVVADMNKVGIFNSSQLRELLIANRDKIERYDDTFFCDTGVVKHLLLGQFKLEPFQFLDEELIERFRIERERATARLLEKEKH